MRHPINLPNISKKVRFLSDPQAYPDGATAVEIRETHMSWVFLTDAHAWKLKKPVRSDYVDFATAESRWRNSEEEVRLNRRLAPSVYLGTVPVTMESSGKLAIGGYGDPVDWLVKMRRLPSHLMLDEAIASHTWTEVDIRRVGALLGHFYLRSTPVSMTGPEYRSQLREDLLSTRSELLHSQYKLPPGLVKAQARKGLSFITQEADMVEERASSNRIVEAHGDLRPEHICLEAEPVIVDCLEFNRRLRLLDPASELAFLALECSRLGAPRIGDLLFEEYRQRTSDNPPDRLLEFYRIYHSCVRAKVAAWHLRDSPSSRADKWMTRAIDYLRT